MSITEPMLTALIVFLITYTLIATERFPRHALALLGAVVIVLLGIFELKEAFTFVDWQTMGLLFGMFILIAILSEAGFFTWLASWVAAKLNYRPTYIFIAFPLLAAFMAAFMDSITVMLFLSALTIRIAKLIKIDPIPLIATEVCAANTGGASTLVGDPPNVILGTMLGFTFNDFVVHTGPIAVTCAIIITLLMYMANRRMLQRAEHELRATDFIALDYEGLITNPRLLRLGLAGFGVAIFFLITHVWIEHTIGLKISTAVAALLPALVVMILGGEETRHIVEKIDIESLLFFLGLFILMGGLEHTHFIRGVAEQIFYLVQNNPFGLLMMLHWGAGLTSAIVDNIPMALAMAYVMKNMANLPGAPALSIMVWALALGVDMGGNITPVGASPNVVAYAYTERNYGKIGWRRWITMTAPATLVAMLVASFLLYLKYMTGWY